MVKSSKRSLPKCVHVFLDANITLHFQRPDQIDWLRLVGARTVNLVVTPVLLREIDRQKALHTSRRIRERAHAILRWLTPYMRGEKQSEIRPSVTLSFVPSEPLFDYASRDLDRTLADDVLIACVLAYSPSDKSPVRLCTADLGLELKLRGRNLEPLLLPEELRLPDEVEPLQQELQRARHELHQLKSRQPCLTISFAEQESLDRIKVNLQVLSLYPLPESLSSVRRRFPLAQARPQRAYQDTIGETSGHFDLASLRLDPVALGQMEADAYNKLIKQYYANHANYISSYQEWAESDARTFELRLLLRNTGNALATDIDVVLRFPETVTLMKIKDRPHQPEVPDPPPELVGFGLGLKLRLSSVDRPLIRDFMAMPQMVDLQGTPSLDAKNGTVSFFVDSLKHHHSFDLDAFAVRFLTSEDVASFSIDYSITAIELPNPMDGRLHVIV